MDKRGFTLLEILLVVVIIGILAGLAIPKFNKTIESAKGKEAYVILETIRTAERMYYLDYGAYSNASAQTPDTWDQLVPDYLLENPNLRQNRNWDYYASGVTCSAVRLGGAYDNYRIGIYINGDMLTTLPYCWPWPPN